MLTIVVVVIVVVPLDRHLEDGELRLGHTAAVAVDPGQGVADLRQPDLCRHRRQRVGEVRAEQVERAARRLGARPEDLTVTAGNASPLTDGASAVLLMSEEKAKALGLEPMGEVTVVAPCF